MLIFSNGYDTKSNVKSVARARKISGSTHLVYYADIYER
jgi:hypothetical protein